MVTKLTARLITFTAGIMSNTIHHKVILSCSMHPQTCQFEILSLKQMHSAGLVREFQEHRDMVHILRRNMFAWCRKMQGVSVKPGMYVVAFVERYL